MAPRSRARGRRRERHLTGRTEAVGGSSEAPFGCGWTAKEIQRVGRQRNGVDSRLQMCRIKVLMKRPVVPTAKVVPLWRARAHRPPTGGCAKCGSSFVAREPAFIHCRFCEIGRASCRERV